MLGEIRELLDYNAWANTTMLDALLPLSSEELHRDLGGSFTSVHGTLVHMAGAEWVWLLRWRGETAVALPDTWGGDSLEAVRVRWAELQDEQRAFGDRLTEEELKAGVRYRNSTGEFIAPLWQLIRHVVNHATYHRGQITMMLRQLGHKPINTDLVRFHREIVTNRAPG